MRLSMNIFLRLIDNDADNSMASGRTVIAEIQAWTSVGEPFVVFQVNVKSRLETGHEISLPYCLQSTFTNILSYLCMA